LVLAGEPRQKINKTHHTRIRNTKHEH